MRVAFYTTIMTPRGSGVAIYDYAHFNEVLLGNDSIIITTKKNASIEAYMHWSRRFRIAFTEDKDNIDDLLKTLQIDVLYMISYGNIDNFQKPPIPTIIHCVFSMNEPFGDVYVGVSKALAEKFNSKDYLNHIVSLKYYNDQRPRRYLPISSLRKELCIPEDAFVFGRHGGADTFNVEFAKQVISEIVRLNSNIFFIFMTTADILQWDHHPNIVFIPAVTSFVYKEKFISTCDAMIVPEMLGHTFGLSIAEFAIYDKPIVCYSGNVWNNAHVDLLKVPPSHPQHQSPALYFHDPDTLKIQINKVLTAHYTASHSSSRTPPYYTQYHTCTPENVMREFKRLLAKAQNQM